MELILESTRSLDERAVIGDAFFTSCSQMALDSWEIGALADRMSSVSLGVFSSTSGDLTTCSFNWSGSRLLDSICTNHVISIREAKSLAFCYDSSAFLFLFNKRICSHLTMLTFLVRMLAGL